MEHRHPSAFGRLLSVLTALSLIFIVACGGGRMNMRPVITAEAKIDPTKGIVVARFINAGPYSLPFNYMTITPENLNVSKDIKEDRLSALADYSKGNTLFASEVNTGKYALSDLYSLFFFGEYSYSRFISADTKFGTFKVEPGKVTDLGTIIYYPKPQGDRYQDVLIRIPSNEAGEILPIHFPFYQFDESRVLGWDDDGRDEERESIFASIAQNPVIFDDQYVGPDGTLYFLAKLGIILKRTPGGDWEVDGVDTNLMLTSIASNKNGDVFVGGVEGALYRKLSGSDEWEDISLNHQNTISHIEFVDQQNIDLVSYDKYKVRIARANALDQTLNWQTLNTFDANSGWDSKNALEDESKQAKINKKNKYKAPKTAKQKVSYANVSSVMGKNLIHIGTKKDAEGSAFRSSKTHAFEYQKDSWVVTDFDDDSDISSIIDSGNGKVGIEEAGFWSWSGKPTYNRYDSTSKNWVEIKTRAITCGKTLSKGEKCKKGQRKGGQHFELGGLPYFFDDMNAIIVAKFTSSSFIEANGDKAKYILKTEDGGKTWLDTGFELPSKYCSSIVPQMKERLIISCRGVSSDFYESTDGGATWDHVRQHENF